MWRTRSFTASPATIETRLNSPGSSSSVGAGTKAWAVRPSSGMRTALVTPCCASGRADSPSSVMNTTMARSSFSTLPLQKLAIFRLKRLAGLGAEEGRLLRLGVGRPDDPDEAGHPGGAEQVEARGRLQRLDELEVRAQRLHARDIADDLLDERGRRPCPAAPAEIEADLEGMRIEAGLRLEPFHQLQQLVGGGEDRLHGRA